MRKMYKGEASCSVDASQMKAMEAAGWSAKKLNAKPTIPAPAPQPRSATATAVKKAVPKARPVPKAKS